MLGIKCSKKKCRGYDCDVFERLFQSNKIAKPNYYQQFKPSLERGFMLLNTIDGILSHPKIAFGHVRLVTKSGDIDGLPNGYTTVEENFGDGRKIYYSYPEFADTVEFVVLDVTLMPRAGVAHANLCVLDIRRKVLYMFEPNGKFTAIRTDQLLRAVAKVLTKHSPFHIKKGKVLIKYAIQVVEGHHLTSAMERNETSDGNCWLWTMAFMGYLYIHVDNKELYKHKDFVGTCYRRFIGGLFKYSEDLHVFIVTFANSLLRLNHRFVEYIMEYEAKKGDSISRRLKNIMGKEVLLPKR